MSHLLKILAIDVGIVWSGVFGIKMDSVHKVVNNEHSFYVFMSFAKELDKKFYNKVYYTVCGQEKYLSTHTLHTCIDYAIDMGYRIVLLPYHGENKNDAEKYIIKKALKRNIIFIMAAGNYVSHDIRFLEPHKHCLFEPNCFFVSNPLNKGFRYPNLTLDIPAKVCLTKHVCVIGSSLSVGRFAAQLINRGGVIW